MCFVYSEPLYYTKRAQAQAKLAIKAVPFPSSPPIYPSNTHLLTMSYHVHVINVIMYVCMYVCHVMSCHVHGTLGVAIVIWHI
jgi:hypothetical protein